MVERSAVNRLVVGSNPTSGAISWSHASTSETRPGNQLWIYLVRYGPGRPIIQPICPISPISLLNDGQGGEFEEAELKQSGRQSKSGT